MLEVAGIGGCGKSLLALEYATVFAPAYPGGIFLLSARGIAEGKPITREEREKHRNIQLKLIAQSEFWRSRHTHQDAGLEPSIEQPYLWIVDDLHPRPRAGERI